MSSVLWSDPLWRGTLAGTGAGVVAWFVFRIPPLAHDKLHIFAMTLVVLQAVILLPWWPLFARAVRAAGKPLLVGERLALVIMVVAVATAGVVVVVFAHDSKKVLQMLSWPILIIHVAVLSILVQTPSLAGSWMIGILVALPFVLVAAFLEGMAALQGLPPAAGVGLALVRLFECPLVAAVLGPAVALSFAPQHLDRQREAQANLDK